MRRLLTVCVVVCVAACGDEVIERDQDADLGAEVGYESAYGYGQACQSTDWESHSLITRETTEEMEARDCYPLTSTSVQAACGTVPRDSQVTCERISSGACAMDRQQCTTCVGRAEYQITDESITGACLLEDEPDCRLSASIVGQCWSCP